VKERWWKKETKENEEKRNYEEAGAEFVFIFVSNVNQ
jgi:hypothetical protein